MYLLEMNIQRKETRVGLLAKCQSKISDKDKAITVDIKKKSKLKRYNLFYGLSYRSTIQCSVECLIFIVYHRRRWNGNENEMVRYET